jgi:hypothetical protein
MFVLVTATVAVAGVVPEVGDTRSQDAFALVVQFNEEPVLLILIF